MLLRTGQRVTIRSPKLPDRDGVVMLDDGRRKVLVRWYARTKRHVDMLDGRLLIARRSHVARFARERLTPRD